MDLCGCRRPFGEGKGFCNAKKQHKCERLTTDDKKKDCLCGLPARKQKEKPWTVQELEKLFEKPEENNDLLVCWWNAVCTCPEEVCTNQHVHMLHTLIARLIVTAYMLIATYAF